MRQFFGDNFLAWMCISLAIGFGISWMIAKHYFEGKAKRFTGASIFGGIATLIAVMSIVLAKVAIYAPSGIGAIISDLGGALSFAMTAAAHLSVGWITGVLLGAALGSSGAKAPKEPIDFTSD